MKVAVVGSRTFTNYKLMCQVLDRFLDKIDLVISGGANGADDLAYKYAKEHSIVFRMYPAKWEEYGKGAGFKRNVLIAQDCDMMVAFHVNNSKGTTHAISKAKQFDKPLLIIRNNNVASFIKSPKRKGH